MAFLPVTKEELNGERADFIVVSCDAYVDHPSFGHAIIARLAESMGFRIGVIPQPLTDAEYRALGEPTHGFLVSGGVVDSMVSNYTVAKKRRDKDEYSEDGKTGKTPDRAITVHTRNLKRLFPSKSVIIGGIEASLRRAAHYDYWSDTVRPSVLLESGADLLVYGMGEVPLKEILRLVARGARIEKIRDVRGTAYLSAFDALPKKLRENAETGGAVFLPSFEDTRDNKFAFVKAFNLQHANSSYVLGATLLQKHGGDYVVINPPAKPPEQAELDAVYALPFERAYHPRYKAGIPALTEVKFSLTSHRGCFGDCSYCALTLHQGRNVSKRSKESLIEEAEKLKALPDFKGYIHDVGGPSANFREPPCKKAAEKGECAGKECIGYAPCKNLKPDHTEYTDILRSLRALPGVKKVFVRSGIRYDYLMLDPNRDRILREIAEHHISGQLKVAPEHCAENVLKLMNKPPFERYTEFSALFKRINAEIGKEQYIVPYLISSHPGCTRRDAIALAIYLKGINYMPLQVQDFYPTPGTKSTVMYYTGIDPDTGKEVYTAKTGEEKREQRALMQYGLPQNYEIVRRALIAENMTYLIGNGRGCLIPARPPAWK
ncbi:MAG: YgiQ family radical SAM protein [Clostridiaceae bacterium]|jgi:uncharacterized radical SAM protein YgiQ|nr:YgiQ family radical SAM protein [Clostridiaceae bacterium]